MELSKVGGVYWSPDPNKITGRRPTGISPLEKTDSIADFLHDVKQLKSSGSIDIMLAIKREHHQRKFMNHDLKAGLTFK